MPALMGVLLPMAVLVVVLLVVLLVGRAVLRMLLDVSAEYGPVSCTQVRHAANANGERQAGRGASAIERGTGVELAGLEPATSWVRSRRSPN